MSEVILAYDRANIAHDPNPDAADIEALARNGFFVVVADRIAFCPFTDAPLRNRTRTRYSAHTTANLAFAMVEHLTAEEEKYGDGGSFAVVRQTACGERWITIVRDRAAELLEEDPQDTNRSVHTHLAQLRTFRGFWNATFPACP